MRVLSLLVLLTASLITGCASQPPELRDLDDIYRQVATRFVYTYDRADEWQIPARGARMPDIIFGDCDEFALWVRQLAREKGIPVRLMFVRVGFQGRGHIVAEWNGWVIDQYGVNTNRGNHYRFVSVSDEPGKPWRKVRKAAE